MVRIDVLHPASSLELLPQAHLLFKLAPPNTVVCKAVGDEFKALLHETDHPMSLVMDRTDDAKHVEDLIMALGGNPGKHRKKIMKKVCAEDSTSQCTEREMRHRIGRVSIRSSWKKPELVRGRQIRAYFGIKAEG